MAVSAPPGFAHTSHSRTKLKQVLVKTARQMQHPASQASKEDDMNGHRECCVQTFARGGCEQPFRVVEGLKGSVNHLVEG